jgi:hypothetical protein
MPALGAVSALLLNSSLQTNFQSGGVPTSDWLFSRLTPIFFLLFRP